jgi:hypothetical protein
MIRDLRINLIFEGSSEIMRLFIAREAVDDHLKVAGDLVNPRAPVVKRLSAALKAGLFYAWWFPTRWLGWSAWPKYSAYGPLARHLRFVDRTSRRLARNTFYAMMRFGPGLEKRQAVLGRLVDAGAELFVMAVTCVRADELYRENPGDRTPLELAEVFCRQSRRRVGNAFRTLFRNDDTVTYRAALRLMDGDYAWLEHSVVTLAEIYGPDAAHESSPSAPSEPAAVRTPEPAGAD